MKTAYGFRDFDFTTITQTSDINPKHFEDHYSALCTRLVQRSDLKAKAYFVHTMAFANTNRHLWNLHAMSGNNIETHVWVDAQF